MWYDAMRWTHPVFMTTSDWSVGSIIDAETSPGGLGMPTLMTALPVACDHRISFVLLLLW